MSANEVGQKEYRSDVVHSVMNSLKELVTILTGIALVNTIAQFVTSPSGPKKIEQITGINWLVFLLLIVTTVRFYHGNMRLLDDTYGLFSEGDGLYSKYSSRRDRKGADFFSILIQSLIFCALSFYTSEPLYVYCLMILLLIVDIFWWIAVELTGTVQTYQKLWTVNNFAAVILFLILYVISAEIQLSEAYRIIMLGLLLLGNAIADYILNRKLFFPSSYK